MDIKIPPNIKVYISAGIFNFMNGYAVTNNNESVNIMNDLDVYMTEVLYAPIFFIPLL